MFKNCLKVCERKCLRILYYTNTSNVSFEKARQIRYGRISFSAELKTSLLVREVLSSITGPLKLDAVSPMAHHRGDVSSELRCPGAKVAGLSPTTRCTLRGISAGNMMKI